jgi:hypothetical protein
VELLPGLTIAHVLRIQAMKDLKRSYSRQIRRLGIDAQTAETLAAGLAANGGQLPPELHELAPGALTKSPPIAPRPDRRQSA